MYYNSQFLIYCLFHNDYISYSTQLVQKVSTVCAYMQCIMLLPATRRQVPYCLFYIWFTFNTPRQ